MWGGGIEVSSRRKGKKFQSLIEAVGIIPMCTPGLHVIFCTPVKQTNANPKCFCFFRVAKNDTLNQQPRRSRRVQIFLLTIVVV